MLDCLESNKSRLQMAIFLESPQLTPEEDRESLTASLMQPMQLCSSSGYGGAHKFCKMPNTELCFPSVPILR